MWGVSRPAQDNPGKMVWENCPRRNQELLGPVFSFAGEIHGCPLAVLQACAIESLLLLLLSFIVQERCESTTLTWPSTNPKWGSRQGKWDGARIFPSFIPFCLGRRIQKMVRWAGCWLRSSSWRQSHRQKMVSFKFNPMHDLLEGRFGSARCW